MNFNLLLGKSQLAEHANKNLSSSPRLEQGYSLNVNRCTAGSTESISEVVRRAVVLVHAWGSLMGGQGFGEDASTVNIHTVEQYFNVCKEEFVRGNAEERARADAEDFVFPLGDLGRDGERLKELGSIENVVRERHLYSRPQRFNSDRYQHLSETKDASVLHELATTGAAIPVGGDFVINPVAEAPRQLQHKLGKCYFKHAYKLWKSGGALLFQELDIPDNERVKLNFNPLHWCPKPFCPGGRWLGDLSNRETGTPINCPESKCLAQLLFGEMSYPSIEEIISAWLTYADVNHYALSDLRIWKEDIRSAFAQFNIKPEDTYKLAFSLGDGLILVMIWGFFGWTGAPMVFANFSRAMLEVLARICLGVLFLFCDDFIGCGHHSVVNGDQVRARELIENVFGEDKVAWEKSVTPSTKAEVLGWWVDLEQQTIRPSDKSIRKLMFVFFSINANASHWSLEVCQMLASLAQRYSQALMGMRPFVHAFHEMCGGVSTKLNQWRKVSGRARFAVEMWRVCLIMLFINKEHMSVSLRVMVKSPSGFEVRDLITDGSYLGLGMLVLEESKTVNECEFAGYLFKFTQNRSEADKSKYQNHREFFGLVVGLIMLILLNKIPETGAVIRWVNDNTAALDWARKNMCKGKSSQVLFMFYSALLIKYKLHIVQVNHTAGSSLLMKPVDALSRGLDTPELSSNLRVDLSNLAPLDELAVICNPTIVQSLQDYHCVFEQIHDLLYRFDSARLSKSF